MARLSANPHANARRSPTGIGGPFAASTGQAGANNPLAVAHDEHSPILPAIASGQPGSADALLDRYGALVWSLARRMTPTAADAEDAVQDVMVELVRSAHRFDASIAGEATFIATIARRRLVDRARRRGRDKSEPASDHVAGVADTRDPERASNTVVFGEDARRAFEAMAVLSEEQRRCISLWACHGLSHEKISRATGLPLGTIKAHIRRGLARLRRHLTDPHEHSPHDNGRTEGQGAAP